MKGEFELIAELVRKLPPPGQDLITPIGDDAAVIARPRHNVVATVDMFVEGVHFDLKLQRPEEVGHKALAINLSDLAAMGSKPRYALVSLGIPEDLKRGFFTTLYRGMAQLARRHDVQVIGGNLSRCSSLVIDIAALGEVSGRGTTRSGARSGDLVGLTGPTGLAAAGRNCLERLGRKARSGHSRLVQHFVKPSPRILEGLALRQVVTSMIDISDGLSSELNHLSEMSGVSIEVDQALIPLNESLLIAAKKLHGKPWDWVLNGGEDYELLFTFAHEREPQVKQALMRSGCTLRVIGKVSGRGRGVNIKTARKSVSLKPGGWNHFLDH